MDLKSFGLKEFSDFKLEDFKIFIFSSLTNFILALDLGNALTFETLIFTFTLMRRGYLILAIIWLFALSCVYSFKGFFPSELKKVWVPVFENITLRYGLENYVTQSFQDAMVKDGRLEVSDSTHAGMKLVGKVTGYKKEPFSYDKNGKILEYKITITAEIGFLRLSTGEYYLKPSTFSGWGLYSADTEEEEDGIKKAVKDLTDNVLRALFSKEF